MKNKINQNLKIIYIILIPILVFTAIIILRINMNFEHFKIKLILPLVLVILAFILYKKVDIDTYKNSHYEENELENKGIKFVLDVKEAVIKKSNGLFFIEFCLEYNSKKYFLVTKENYSAEEIEGFFKCNAKATVYVNHMNFKNYKIKIL